MCCRCRSIYKWYCKKTFNFKKPKALINSEQTYKKNV